eukprot:scaffold81827_cov57-Phaeocystis_antarctica.AAC.2
MLTSNCIGPSGGFRRASEAASASPGVAATESSGALFEEATVSGEAVRRLLRDDAAELRADRRTHRDGALGVRQREGERRRDEPAHGARAAEAQLQHQPIHLGGDDLRERPCVRGAAVARVVSAERRVAEPQHPGPRASPAQLGAEHGLAKLGSRPWPGPCRASPSRWPVGVPRTPPRRSGIQGSM